MADNLTLNSGSGGATAATDDIAGVHFQRMKLIHGADGSNDGDVAAANPLPVQVLPVATNGCSVHRSIDLDESEEEVKATAGTVFGFAFSNLSTSTRFLKFYNATAASVTVGTTTPLMTIALPGNASDDVSGVYSLPQGVKFDTAICIAATTGVADGDTGAPGANEVLINVFYK